MFITFEGVDGSGKSTQARLLVDRLRAAGRDVVGTREPGGTDIGEEIRDLLLHSERVAPWAEATLFSAARAQLVDEVIKTGAGPRSRRGLRPLPRFLARLPGPCARTGRRARSGVNLTVTSGLLPDRTFLLLVPGEVAAHRRGRSPDRIESEGDEFAAEVDRAYREIAEIFAQRVVVLDGTEAPQKLAEEIDGHLRDLP
jgi:dTMP kinase